MVPRFAALYAIIDRETLDRRGLSVGAFAEELRDGGARLLQYRDKKNAPQEVLRAAGQIADIFASTEATLILNDRADLAALLGWGVHVGQGDLSVEAARRVVGNKVVGVSTHNESQLRAAAESSADYIAIGPVFATSTKLDTDPVVGLEGVRAARAQISQPLVAIGGIGLANALNVREVGADSVAVISALVAQNGLSTEKRTRELIARLKG